LKGLGFIDIGLAKKFFFLSGPVGISSDITPKRGFFATLFECKEELKRFLRCNVGGIWIEIHLNLKINDSLKLISYSRIVS
jgi:hypothetical protein